MLASKCPPSAVQEMFRSLLYATSSTNSNVTDPPQLSVSAAAQPLTGPPAKNTIRFIENNENNRREKYDGCRWRLVCTWNGDECTNLVYARQLCTKHNAIHRHKELTKKKKKVLFTNLSLPILNQHNPKNARIDNDDDDDIEILEEYCKQATIRRSMNSNVKLENHDFNVFSVEHLDEAHVIHPVKSEPIISSTSRQNFRNDIEYVSSKTRANGLNITELMSKNLPPLTEFEEEFIANRLMEKHPTTCPMLDAQLSLHREAIAVVYRNYRLKMDTVAPEYFYDFLLRHPRLALHYSHWFLQFKPIPPTTGCPIDTKFWTLSMIVRGAMATDNMADEYTG